MPRLSKETKDRLTAVVNAGKFVFHWGFVPTVLYLGFQKGSEPGMPPITIMSLLWQ